MESLPIVDLDDDGTFKYIQIDYNPDGSGQTHTFVRGYADCAYHSDIFYKFEYTSKLPSGQLDCPGGGRIQLKKE